VAAADADRRTTIAGTLLTQPHIPTADRVAGLLVTVYGQHLSRLVALRTSDLARRSDVVCLSRGTHWLKLPDPLGTWAWDLRDQAGHSSVQPPGDAGDRWLFPGSLPGRPLRPASLGNRLRRYGITARAARNDALTDVAAAVAPITLASLLDMHPNTANTWAEASSGSWARYLDDLLDDHDDGATDYQQAHP
jgi:integrase